MSLLILCSSMCVCTEENAQIFTDEVTSGSISATVYSGVIQNQTVYKLNPSEGEVASDMNNYVPINAQAGFPDLPAGDFTGSIPYVFSKKQLTNNKKD